MSAGRYVDDLTLATSLARAAAAAIVDVTASARRDPSRKADDSPVTPADLAADGVIRAGLAGSGDLIVTEETWSDRALPSSGRVWIVDPLDGTSDFVAGRADYVVQIALVEDGVPRVGVLCHPPSGTVWRGVVDGAASLCERIDDATTTTLRLSATTPLPARPRVCVSVSHPSAVVDFIGDVLGADVVGVGSVGLKIGAIVDGRADLYLSGSRRIKVWDTAAPAAVLAAAGGTMTSLSGRPLRYDGDVRHDDGVAAFSPAALAIRPAIDDAVRRFRDQQRGRA
jgi:3'(2'), 5'-bisphosphate nucleotidase